MTEDQVNQQLAQKIDAANVTRLGVGNEIVYAYGSRCAPDRLKIGMKKTFMKSLLEWHRWFAWYPVPVMRKGKLRYAWLRFVERKWGTSRYSGTFKWRYRLPTRSRMR